MVRGIRKEKGRKRSGRIMRGKHAGIKESPTTGRRRGERIDVESDGTT